MVGTKKQKRGKTEEKERDLKERKERKEEKRGNDAQEASKGKVVGREITKEKRTQKRNHGGGKEDRESERSKDSKQHGLTTVEPF